LTALGAIRALTKAGIKVPEQCSVVGFDDVPLSALAAPSLTTVRQPLEAMGNLAASTVVEGIKALLPQLQATLPAAIDLNILTDRTVTIRASVRDVEYELSLAVVLVVMLMCAALRIPSSRPFDRLRTGRDDVLWENMSACH